MTTDRFNNCHYHFRKIKPGSHGMMKGFILALSIHGVLFFIGEAYLGKPVQYSVPPDKTSINVDLVTAVSQSDTTSVQSNTFVTEKLQEPSKAVPQEKPVIPAQPEGDTVEPITSVTEAQQKAVKIMPQEDQVTQPQSNTDAVKPITSVTEKQQELVKAVPGKEPAKPAKPAKPEVDTDRSITSTIQKQQETADAMPLPSQGTIRTKSKPGYFRNQPPEYPQLAKQMRQEGLVILRVEIDQKGIPVQVEVKQGSGFPLLDQAALKAVKRWRFQPEQIGDSPVKSVVAIPVRFRLEDSERRSH